MNRIRPYSYNIKRIVAFYEDDMEITTVDIDEDEAVALKLAVPVKVTQLK